MIASSSLFKYISDFRIDDKNITVHFPLNCQFCFRYFQNNQCTNLNKSLNLRDFQKYKWKEELKEEFYDKFCNCFHDFKEKISNRHDRLLSSYIYDFIDVFKNAGENMKSYYKQYSSTQPIWWDNECNIAKIEKSRALRHFRVTNYNHDLITYKTKRDRFKSICLKKKTVLAKKKRNALVSSRKNAKLFWKTLKANSTNRDNTCNITPETIISKVFLLLMRVIIMM